LAFAMSVIGLSGFFTSAFGAPPGPCDQRRQARDECGAERKLGEDLTGASARAAVRRLVKRSLLTARPDDMSSEASP
jgi:hypothetical protein